MNKTELLELIAKGESSFAEFKCDAEDLKAETMAEYVVCFSNAKGADYLRDYNDLDKTGRGIPRKIIKGMLAHNGKEPGFELRGESLRVTLWA